MLQILGLLLLSVTHAASSEKLSYEDAYAKAQKEEKVLLVVVGADWCSACKTLKSATIEPMQKSGKLETVILAQVDKDLQPELAKQMMSGSTLPQLVAFKHSESGWKRFSLSGIQTEGRVEELIKVATGEPKSASESAVVAR